MNRRDFLKTAAGISGMAFMSSFNPPLLSAAEPMKKARVAFVKTNSRASGVSHAIDLLDLGSFKGKDLFVKPNFNSSDETPGSTHIDTLNALLRKLQALQAGPLTIGDRSGMGDTRQVMQKKDAFRLAKEVNAKAIVFDDLSEKEWDHIDLQNSYWQRGFSLPKPVRSAEGIVQTCCLKTHRYGGHFTLSLKNSVGLAAKIVPGDSYDYMRELHSSPHQRHMIAEINTAYKPDLVVLDGVEAFVNGGPDTGKKVNSQVILAGTDRVAIDAVGVALLRYYGTTPEVSKGAIFEQEQIARAVQLGIGVSAPDQIELVTDDPESATYAQKIRNVLDGKALNT